MKTHEEIKKGLRYCNGNHPNCSGCPYDTDEDYENKCLDDLQVDALDYIVQLEYRLAHVERERDALRRCICGSTVYKLITTKDGSGSIVEEQLCGFHYIDPPKQRSNKRGNYMIVYHESTGHITHLPVSQIGKTVFFTYEDAKTALDERRGVCEENTKEEN